MKASFRVDRNGESLGSRRVADPTVWPTGLWPGDWPARAAAVGAPA